MEIEEIKNMMLELEKSSLKKIMIKKADFELVLEKDTAMPAARQAESFLPPPKQEDSQSSKKSNTEDFVKSPIVGTYYASSAPDQPPFVKVGDRVTDETVVCIVEAMKMMNEVKAGKNGIIAEILVDNADPVEYGTPLFRIE